MHTKKIVTTGTPLKQGGKALILLHGRGADAADILGLAQHLHTDGFTLLAPEATNNTWYPYSFLVPRKDNEPWLSSALGMVKELVSEIKEKGIESSHIYFAGFSQGACLTLDFVAGNPQHYGGVAAFTGGLIGDMINPEEYSGDFEGTPVYIGTSDPDPHVPVSRVRETESILRKMNAEVSVDIYPAIGHTVSMEEINRANRLIFR